MEAEQRVEGGQGALNGEILVLSEATLPRALWQGWRGRPMRMVAVHALVRGSTGLLERVARWASARGWLSSAFEGPRAVPIKDGYPGDALLRPYHPGIEAGIHPLLDDVEAHPVLGSYAYAFRKALTDYTQAMLNLTGAAMACQRIYGAGGWRLVGAPPHFARVFALSTGAQPAAWLAPACGGARIANGLNALSLWLGVSAWLLVRTRPRVAIHRFRLAIDRIHPADMRLAALIDDPRDVLMIERNRVRAAQAEPGLEPYTRVTRDDARLPPRATVVAIARLAAHLWALWREMGGHDAPLFARYATLLGKRRVFDAFFHRFRPACLWARDDYSMDHVVRNQSLRGVGGIAMGVNHGLPMNTYVSQWREIDFDVYFTYGRHLYETVYRQSWRSGMRVVPAGNIEFTPERRAAVQAGPRPLDIAVFGIVSSRFTEFLDEVRRLAGLFPDRKVILRMKALRETEYTCAYQRLIASAPPNLVADTGESAYDLMLRVGYAVSTGSTTTAEALQFGVTSFALDIEPELQFFYYRQFPRLIVTSAEDLARRIRAIEAGEETFDFHALEPLIAVSAPDFCDIVGPELGLVPAGGQQ